MKYSFAILSFVAASSGLALASDGSLNGLTTLSERDATNRTTSALAIADSIYAAVMAEANARTSASSKTFSRRDPERFNLGNILSKRDDYTTLTDGSDPLYQNAAIISPSYIGYKVISNTTSYTVAKAACLAYCDSVRKCVSVNMYQELGNPRLDRIFSEKSNRKCSIFGASVTLSQMINKGGQLLNGKGNPPNSIFGSAVFSAVQSVIVTAGNGLNSNLNSSTSSPSATTSSKDAVLSSFSSSSSSSSTTPTTSTSSSAAPSAPVCDDSVTPPGYSLSWGPLTTATDFSAPDFLGYNLVPSCEPALCASLCDSNPSCVFFNTWTAYIPMIQTTSSFLCTLYTSTSDASAATVSHVSVLTIGNSRGWKKTN